MRTRPGRARGYDVRVGTKAIVGNGRVARAASAGLEPLTHRLGTGDFWFHPGHEKSALALKNRREAPVSAGPMAHVAAEVAALPRCETVPTIDASELSAAEFAERFMRPNKPVLLTGVSNGWRCRSEWTREDQPGERVPDISRMADLFGDAKVLVVDCDAPLDTDLSRQEMPFREYARYWHARRDDSRGKDGGGDARLLYCKDWTFAEDFPDYPAYETPPHFADDWLNEYWDEQRVKGVGRRLGSHRFVYVGGKGTDTPLHADVLRSFSWSVNLAGRKRWLMVPPHRAHHLLDAKGERRPKDIERADVDRFPNAAKSAPVVVEQPGDSALFVPSLWYHQVRNETDCVSVNHNWLNAANARLSWAMLRDELEDVRAGLADPDDAGDGVLCQSLVERRAGADFKTFAGILASAARRHGKRALAAATEREGAAAAAAAGGGDRSGKRRRVDGAGASFDDEKSLRVAVDLLEEVLAADEAEDASRIASAWEGSDDALEEARDAAKEGRETLERLGGK